MLIPLNVTIFLEFIQVLTVENELGLSLMEILKSVKEVHYYHTIIYLNDVGKFDAGLYNVDTISRRLDSPLIQLKGNTSFYLWPSYNRELLALVTMSGEEGQDKTLLEILWRTLRRSLKTKVLLLFRAEVDDEYLSRIMEFCRDYKAVNVAAIKESFFEIREFYSPQIFPKFGIVANKFGHTLYPDHVKNMHRFPLHLGINLGSNNAYVLNVANNEYILGGHVGHFFAEFARVHNATISFPHYNLSTTELFLTTLEKLVNNGTYDISMELSYNLYINDMVYSYIYDFMDWCIMVPMEAAIPAYKYYVEIFDLLIACLIVCTLFLLAAVVTLTFWLDGYPISWQDALLNIYIFNGLLGQSYKMEINFTGVRSCLYVLTCIGGLIINTTYVTYLQTFNARPPTEKAINTWDDVRASGLKLALYIDEFMMLKMYGFPMQHESLTVLIPTYREYYTLRDTFDARYGYPVTSAQWSQYEEQQKFFAKPKFRLTDICFVKMIGLMLPMQPNSIYEDGINKMIGLVNQAGLVNHWKSLAFLEAVQRKRLSLMDSSRLETFEALKLADTILLAYLFAVLICVACLCLIAEICWSRRGPYLRKWRGITNK